MEPEVASALQTLAALEDEFSNVEQQMQGMLALVDDPHTLAGLTPLQRASTFLSLSKALNTVFSLHIRCKGLSPNEAMKSEMERVSLYDAKIGYYTNDLKGPQHRSTAINVQAANRFIEHAIPDLTEEQKKDLRDNNKQQGFRKPNNLQNTPIRPDKTESLKEAVSSFLEVTRRDLNKEI